MSRSQANSNNMRTYSDAQLIGYDSKAVKEPSRDYSPRIRTHRKKHEFKPVSNYAVLIPQKTAEEWAENDRLVEEWENGEVDLRYNTLLETSGILPEFQHAEINRCHDGARVWADSVLAEENNGMNLYIKGKVGRGKTYTACAVMLYLMPKIECRIVQFDDVLREIRDTFQGRGSEDEVIRKYADVTVLCLDDFGKAHMTEWALPVLFTIIDKRWTKRLPTIFTTQYDGEHLAERLTTPGNEDTAKAILSRMKNSVQMTLEGEDRRHD